MFWYNLSHRTRSAPSIFFRFPLSTKAPSASSWQPLLWLRHPLSREWRNCSGPAMGHGDRHSFNTPKRCNFNLATPYFNWLVVSNIFIFHNIWDNPSHWLLFSKMVKTTNQLIYLSVVVNWNVVSIFSGSLKPVYGDRSNQTWGCLPNHSDIMDT